MINTPTNASSADVSAAQTASLVESAVETVSAAPTSTADDEDAFSRALNANKRNDEKVKNLFTRSEKSLTDSALRQAEQSRTSNSVGHMGTAGATGTQQSSDGGATSPFSLVGGQSSAPGVSAGNTSGAGGATATPTGDAGPHASTATGANTSSNTGAGIPVGTNTPTDTNAQGGAETNTAANAGTGANAPTGSGTNTPASANTQNTDSSSDGFVDPSEHNIVGQQVPTPTSTQAANVNEAQSTNSANSSLSSEDVQEIATRILTATKADGSQEIRITLSEKALAGTEVTINKSLDGQLTVQFNTNNADSFQTLVGAQGALKEALMQNNENVRVEVRSDDNQQDGESKTKQEYSDPDANDA